MLKQHEQVQSDSCLNRAGSDEPIFVLRAHDSTAPDTLRFWATAYAAHKQAYNTDGLLTARQQSKVRDALDWAVKMEEWQRVHHIPLRQR